LIEPRRVVYNSFNGRFSDNPRAIYEELVRRTGGVEHVWMAREPPSAFPAGAGRALPGEEGFSETVDAAKYVVANVEMREHLDKRPGTVFLQTWHGTALKRIGYDNRYVHANPAGFERDADEYRRWDYLVSPNPLTTSVMTSAFRGFEGEILETGYPRNDILSSPASDQVRDRVRAQLGIEPGQTAVLYAPTWRDNLFHEQGPGAFRLELDVDALAARLGGDHVLMLRLHFLVADAVDQNHGPEVVNVSAYEDVRDLYLAADVLITDYSSVMFDFAITRKPQLFFTYDLDFYRDELRGFYFDFEGEAPGPLCRTSDELIAALGDVAGTARSFTARYEAFRERYCSLEDGRASARVVDRVFADLL
jgi:CDP-glycerol glycerophosphotransferase